MYKTDDDFCDLYENKICDNCGKCLEAQGIDTKAIKIEDIARNVEENNQIVDDWKKSNELNSEDDNLILQVEDIFSEDEYTNLSNDIELDIEESNADYIDAFENITYIEDLEGYEEGNIDELTEEIFPGVRRARHSEL